MCNWDEIKFPSQKGDWKKFEKNNVTNNNETCYYWFK